MGASRGRAGSRFRDIAAPSWARTAVTAVPLAVFWLLVLWGLISRRPVLWYMLFGALAFGSFAVVPPQVTGGVTLLPASVVAVFLVAKTLLRPKAARLALDAAIDPKRLGLLTAFVIVAIVSAFLLPRLFAGQVAVVPMRVGGSPTDLLWPTSANLTQAAYLMLSLGVAIAAAVYVRRMEDLAIIVRAVCFGGAIVCLTGVVEMVASRTGAQALLDPFRTASYAIFTDSTVGGTRRAVGLMPEASSFGPLCVGFAAILFLLRSATDARMVNPALQAGVVGLLLLLAALSTSSTAYLGLFALLVLISGNWLRQALQRGQSRPHRRRLAGEMVTAYSAAFMVMIVFLLDPHLLTPITDFVDRMVFGKVSTNSFDERMFWNSMGVAAFVETHGLGVGVGGARTSSWAIAILSNTGLIGSALMLAFLAVCLLKSAPRGEAVGREVMLAAKLTILVSLAMGSISGTTTDFGVFTGFLFGLVMATRWRAGRLNAPLLGHRTNPLSNVSPNLGTLVR